MSSPAASDPFLWLEEIDSPEALAWVRARNAPTRDFLTADPRFARIRDDLRAIATAKDRIPEVALRGEWVYNLWQDETHVRGLWRRARVESFRAPDACWEVLLDLDELGRAEGESWVWKGASCLGPDYAKCVVSLSRGGKDAVVVREFDLASRRFVPESEGGFSLPEAKSSVGWLDADSLWVGTDFGPGTLTESGYPRVAKLWRRGTPLSAARTVFEGAAHDISAGAYTSHAPEGDLHFAYRSLNFFEGEQWLLSPADGRLRHVPFPKDAEFQGVFRGHLLAKLRKEWRGPARAIPAGALVSLPLALVAGRAAGSASPDPSFVAEALGAAEIIHSPDARSAINGISRARDRLYVDLLHNVKGAVLEVSRASPELGWESLLLPFEDNGVVSVSAADPFGELVFARYESFTVPTTLYAHRPDGARPGAARPEAWKSLPARFDASGIEVSQREAVSRDGTRVPYFLIHRKGMPVDGDNPTLLYGYGGFEVSLTPYYLATTAKAWIERGGAYAIANIRGGGELGPAWHQAALKENRPRAFEDFIAVAEGLVRDRVTSSRRLGIMGGSNGGLLMGVMLTQRPDLFRAVVCQVPLLDMLRYHKLLAGASWVGEYGDPDDPAERAAIERYSPYQSLKEGVKYPRALFVTSTRDDRVHPGHARKMAARLESLGQAPLYYENIEGGHGGSADLEQWVDRAGLEFTYLLKELAD